MPLNEFFLLGGIFGLLIFIVITLVEGFILRIMGWTPPGHPFLDAFIMNLVSVIAGTPFISNFLMHPRGLQGIIWYVLFACLWGIYIFLETITIIILRKMSLRSIVVPIVIANIATYLLILPFIKNIINFF